MGKIIPEHKPPREYTPEETGHLEQLWLLLDLMRKDMPRPAAKGYLSGVIDELQSVILSQFLRHKE